MTIFSPQIVSGLKEEILRLRFPHRVQSKEPTPKVKRKGLGGVGGSSPSKSPPTLGPQEALSDRPCLVVLHKPLDKLLIRWVRRGGGLSARGCEQESTGSCPLPQVREAAPGLQGTLLADTGATRTTAPGIRPLGLIQPRLAVALPLPSALAVECPIRPCPNAAPQCHRPAPLCPH